MIRLNRKIVWMIRFAIAAGILTFLYKEIDFHDMISVVGQARWDYVALAIGLAVATQLIAAKRLRLLIHRQAIRFSTFKLLEINLATMFYGLFLPGGSFTSLAVRFYKLAGPDKKAKEALISIFLDRLMATTTVSFMGILFWLIDWPAASPKILIGMGYFLGGLVMLMALVHYGNGVSWSNLLRGILPRVLQEKISEFQIALTRYRHVSARFLIAIILLSIIANLLGTGAYYLLAHAVGINLSFETMGWVRAATLLLCLIPVSLSGLGVREGSFLFFLAPYSIPTASILALVLLIYTTTVFLMGTLGGAFEISRFLWPSLNKDGDPSSDHQAIPS